MVCYWPNPFGMPSGARQYLYINSIDALTLEDRHPIVLRLDSDSYIATSDDPLGYDRYKIADHESIAAYSAQGVPVISGASFEPKHEFRWNLRLSQADANSLTSMYETQQLRWRSLRTNYAVTLLDGRLMYQEPSTRVEVSPGVYEERRLRAAITGAHEANMPQRPAGSVYSYAVFHIMLKRPQDSGELLARGFGGRTNEGTLEAAELEFLDPTYDVAITDINPDTGDPWWDSSEWG